MRVLIAEDEPISRQLLESSLESWGYVVESAADGREAWERLTAEDAPRLAILDWLMPEMSGIEVCRRLRESSSQRPYTYIMLLTSMTGQQDLEKGFEAGVDDFLRKPCAPGELQYRLAGGVRVVRYENRLRENSDRLRRYAEQLEKLAEERARQLVQAERMATLGQLSAGIAHEINNPATFISGNIQLLEKCWPALSEAIDRRLADGEDFPDRSRLEFVAKEFPQLCDGMRKGLRRISDIVRGLKEYSDRGEPELEHCDLNDLVRRSLELCHNQLKYNISVETRLDEQLPTLKGDTRQLQQVLVNLVFNASQALAERKDAHIWIETRRTPYGISLAVEDDGPGIAPEQLERIWDPFYTSKPVGVGTGLGLSIARSIVEEHNGCILCKPGERAGGARFELDLPAAPQEVSV